ncbi:probable serine/threonine-protein kinase ireA [Colossoma macropomum]|uniref:probable serine/threonine-protein kinase ireA n=1 Tax=Colossoma macropomum TaxID=42526 RepID=UPI0018642277|nr:probable serine/threonine-protein kinase ireA [Colossoma macropomum]
MMSSIGGGYPVQETNSSGSQPWTQPNREHRQSESPSITVSRPVYLLLHYLHIIKSFTSDPNTEHGWRTLEDYIMNGHPGKEDLILLVMDILFILNVFHSLNAVHGDIKKQHVVVDNDGRAKLINFEKAERVKAGDGKIQEEIQKTGELAYYILSGGESYPQSDGDGSWTNKDIILDLTEWMTHPDPTKRRSLEDVLYHPIFWTDSRKTRYLQAVGNFSEVKQHHKDAKHDLNKKSKGKSFVNWRQEVEKDFAELLKKMDDYWERNGKPYPNDPCGLLHFIRNVFQHKAEEAPSIKFTSRFPDLFETVYFFAEEKGWNFRNSLQYIFREFFDIIFKNAATTQPEVLAEH